jgi:hypothetical protein
MNIPGIIIILKKNKLDNCSLIPKIINGFGLINCEHKTADSLIKYVTGQDYTSHEDHRTFILDDDHEYSYAAANMHRYGRNFFKKISSFLMCVKTCKITVVIASIGHANEIPFFIRNSLEHNYIFEEEKSLCATVRVRHMPHGIPNCLQSVLQSDEFESYIGEIHRSGDRLPPPPPPAGLIPQSKLKEKSETSDNLGILQTILFDNKEHMSTGEYLDAMNVLDWLYKKLT